MDTSFGASSSGIFSYYNTDEQPTWMILLSSGKLVVGGYVGYDPANTTDGWYDPFVLQVTSSGALDTSFGTSSGITVLYTPTQDKIESMGVQSDGKIVLAGSRNGTWGDPARFLAIRLTSGGLLDTNFATGGYATVQVETTGGAGTVAITSDGRVLLAGKVQQGSDSPDAAVVRLNADGTLDPTFGANESGTVIYNLGYDDYAYGSGIWTGGRLIVAGAASHGNFDSDLISFRLGSNVTTGYIYSSAGQVLAEGDNSDFGRDQYNYVWSPVYVNAMIVRDTIHDSSAIGPIDGDGGDDGGGSEEEDFVGGGGGDDLDDPGPSEELSVLVGRTYVRQDANYNVTSIVTGTYSGGSLTWGTAERYVYTPYGVRTTLTASFGSRSGTLFDWSQGFQGGFEDGAPGTILFGARTYDLSTGTWKQEDPARLGGSLYAGMNDRPVGVLDPMGLWGRDAHYLTVFAVGIMLGLGADMSAELAYYAQLPDQVGMFDAVPAGAALVSGSRDSYLLDVQIWLHSIHGGTAGAVAKRQACLAKMLSDKTLKIWEKGFIIHALGDSFAHVKADGSAYTAPQGHAFDDGVNGVGRFQPDVISKHQGSYSSYVITLIMALGPQQTAASANDIAKYVLGLATNDGGGYEAMRKAMLAAGFHVPWSPLEIDSGNEAMGDWSNTLEQKYPTPTHREVVALIDKMKRACGCAPGTITGNSGGGKQ